MRLYQRHMHTTGQLHTKAALCHDLFSNRVHPTTPASACTTAQSTRKINVAHLSRRSLCGCLTSRTRSLSTLRYVQATRSTTNCSISTIANSLCLRSPPTSRGHIQVRAQWNKEIEWSTAAVKSNDKAATGVWCAKRAPFCRFHVSYQVLQA